MEPLKLLKALVSVPYGFSLKSFYLQEVLLGIENIIFFYRKDDNLVHLSWCKYYITV